MLINSQNLSGIFQGFRVLFKQSFTEQSTFWEKLATKIMSTTGTETYAWLLNIPQMREWVGDREIKNLSADDYTLKNKKFESTVAIPRDAIEDDAIGVYRPAVAMMATEAKTFPDSLLADLIKKGDTNKCYDNKPFFSDSHKIGKNNVSNKGSYKLSIESYGAARAAMMSLKNDEGKSLKIMPNLLVVAPALEGIARKILFAQQIDGSDNIYCKSADLLVLPELAGKDTEWSLLDVSKPIKPFVVQERRPVEFVAKDKPEDDTAFMRDQYLYGTSWRGNAGYTLWQLAYKSTGTTAYKAT